ncbi:MAG: MazG family protein, partial [Mycobacteriales bacterium]
PAWAALRAGPVLTADGGHRQRAALAEAGITVEVVAPDLDLLVSRAADGVVWLATPDGDTDLVRALGLRCISDLTLHLEVLHGSYDLPGARLIDVVAVMDRLRSPGGCPWDAKQTHRSLLPYLVEETYEALEAIEDDDLVGLREELGDVLLQVAFHARLAEEHDAPWSLDEVATDLVDKLIRRHPHVFAGASADDLEGSWEALKQKEKGRTSVTDGIPLGQPALSLAAKLQKRGERVAAPVPAYEGIGGELWALVGRCRAAGLDPEAELRAVAREYRDQIVALEHGVD